MDRKGELRRLAEKIAQMLKKNIRLKEFSLSVRW
jgi:hypothetical protein